VYKAPVVVTSTLPATQVFLANGTSNDMMTEARWPDAGTDALDPTTVEVAQAGSNNTTIMDPALTQNTGYWNNAHVFVQQTWNPKTGTVTASQPGALTITGNYGTFPDHIDLCGGVTAGNTRYFLYGKLSELNAPGEFYYDSTAHVLYFRTPSGAAPATDAVSVKQRSLAFDLSSASYTTITGIKTWGATIQTGDASTNDVLDSLDVEYPSHFMDLVADQANLKDHVSCDTNSAYGVTSGVVLRGTANQLINSTIAHSAGNGVALLGSGHTVSNNVIHDVDYGAAHAAGVSLYSTSSTITSNTIYRVGRCAIEGGSMFIGKSASMPGDVISNNDVYDYGRLAQDFGGIYLVGTALNLTGTSIHHNWMHDPGALANIPPATTAGIYLDGGVQGAFAYDNIGWNNIHGAVALVGAGSGGTLPNDEVVNNDGGVWLFNVQSASGSQVANNLGGIRFEGNTPTDMSFVTSNSPAGIDLAFDPKYRDEGARDFRLSTATPATVRDGIFVANVTVGYTGSSPSKGAIQYDTPGWTPGAAVDPLKHPFVGASSVISADAAWNTTQVPAAWGLGRLDHKLTIGPQFPPKSTQAYARLASFTARAEGSLVLGFTPPTGTGLTITHVELRVYASMNRMTASVDENMTVTVPNLGIPNSGVVFDAAHTPFNAVGKPKVFDLTSYVGGDWTKLPTSVTVYGFENVDTSLVNGPYASGLTLNAVQLHIDAS
jgi:hypothetical protein